MFDIMLLNYQIKKLYYKKLYKMPTNKNFLKTLFTVVLHYLKKFLLFKFSTNSLKHFDKYYEIRFKIVF